MNDKKKKTRKKNEDRKKRKSEIVVGVVIKQMVRSSGRRKKIRSKRTEKIGSVFAKLFASCFSNPILTLNVIKPSFVFLF